MNIFVVPPPPLFLKVKSALFLGWKESALYAVVKTL
jgi:hypothetical protein